ncbi:hypothetical protein LIER_30185 [Lithospermum erythrorhizon]|uniref:Retrovirus-related Pol polyprotein from transposon TNT 1-94-like beta-barrel domain-containing protein n=1 Tax=Lithospermum erythrorhizon TaxID=34254 RepID=A0AAV3RLU0_LITER
MYFLLTSLHVVSFFDTYQNVESAKLFWDQLETRYMREDATSKKFLVYQFNGYTMSDSRSVMEQFHELERMLEDVSLEELANSLRIEEDFRNDEGGKDRNILVKLVNLVEEHLTKARKRPNIMRDCPKRKGGASVSRVGQSSYHGKSTGGNENFTAMISEINVVQNDNDWWVDSSATRHVCKDKLSFKTYEPVKETTFVYMGNKSQVYVL